MTALLPFYLSFTHHTTHLLIAILIRGKLPELNNILKPKLLTNVYAYHISLTASRVRKGVRSNENKGYSRHMQFYVKTQRGKLRGSLLAKGLYSFLPFCFNQKGL